MATTAQRPTTLGELIESGWRSKSVKQEVYDNFVQLMRSDAELGERAEAHLLLAGVFELKLASQQSGAAQKGGHFHADGSFHGEH